MKKSKHSTTNYRALEPFIQATAFNGHAKFTSGGYMDLIIEYLYYSDHEGNPVYSIAHYGKQNGDAMCDPEVVFSINKEKGELYPLEYRNDYMHTFQEVYKTFNDKLHYSPTTLTGIDNFLYVWRKNIVDQGFNPDNYTT